MSLADEKKFELRYSHNIIEHLGLKLYQNKPTNVLAELVSNSWDADAQNLWIDVSEGFICVGDDGSGMTRHEISNNYLIIGKKKRTLSNILELTEKKRKPMGRKGIGKLAPFGIARKVSLITISKETGLCYWMELDLSALLNEENSKLDALRELNYKPKIICDGVKKELVPLDKDQDGSVRKFLNRIKSSGTLVIMHNLSLKKQIPLDKLIQSIGQRFTVTLLKDDFTVYINEEEVTEEQALPEFNFRIPKNSGFANEIINVNGLNREVRYWVGFIEKADWPQDQTGVGVYTHGKIAQDRPFVFGLKGREITTRYMYGVIEADWLDELNEDVVSTDRTSINWDNESANELLEWGRKVVSTWITDYRNYQKENNKDKVKEKFKTLPDIPRITSEEKNIITDMVCNMSPRVYRDSTLQNEVIEKLTSAWTHKPSRHIVKSLWDRLEKSENNEVEFLDILSDIHKHLVPESLSLSVTVAQKIYALTKLYELSINGTENQLQALLESFPWILGSDKGKVYANKALKIQAKQAALNGDLPGHGHTIEELKELSSLPNSSTRPDFSFFSDENKGSIIIVELKSPLVNLNYSHLMQLMTYYFWLKEVYPNAEIKGYLIGKNPSNAIISSDPNIDVITWEKVCLNSRRDYLELLSAMLNGIHEHYGDSRVKDVIEFGGEPTMELLKRMADADSPLQDYFLEIDSKLKR